MVGDVIEESLERRDILKRLSIVSTRVEKVTPAHRTPGLMQRTLHTISIPESQVPAIAEELSGCLDRAHGGSWYVDFKNDRRHDVIYPGKVFCLERNNLEQYKNARRYGIAIGIPEDQVVDLPGPADPPAGIPGSK